MSAPLGFIGLGTMGAAMAARLADAGHALVVSDIARAQAAPLEAKGARFAENASAVACDCRVVFLSLPGPKEIDAVVAALADALPRGSIVVDFSTNAFESVTRLDADLSARGIALLDAPVSGGVAAAVKGKLAVMVGGDAAAFDEVRPLLVPIAAKVFHVGASGMGTVAKLVNNQIFLAAAVTVQEGFVLAAKAGLGADQLLEIVRASSAAAYSGLAPLFFARDFDAAIFKLAIAAKDVAVALDSAKALGVSMPTTEAALAVYQDAVEQGLGEKVFYATLKTLEERADVAVAKLGGGA